MRLLFYLVAAVVCFLAAPAARAADLLDSAAETTWSGAYLGAHLGGAWTSFDGATSFRGETFPSPGVTPGVVDTASFAGPNLEAESFLAGAYAGYAFQARWFVFGVESDLSWLGISDTAEYSISSADLISAGVGAIVETVDGYVSEQERDVEWLATFRGRVGISSSRILLYATGGLAIADVKSGAEFSALLDGGLVSASEEDKGRRIGWTAGAGVEAALTEDVSARLEYLYADLGEEDAELGTYIEVSDIFRQSVSSEDKLTLHLLRLGLNYRF